MGSGLCVHEVPHAQNKAADKVRHVATSVSNLLFQKGADATACQGNDKPEPSLFNSETALA